MKKIKIECKKIVAPLCASSLLIMSSCMLNEEPNNVGENTQSDLDTSTLIDSSLTQTQEATQTQSETDTDSVTTSETQTQSGTDTETASETQTQSETSTDTETSSETQSETDTQTDTQSETTTQSETMTQTDSETMTESQTNTQTQTETEVELEVIIPEYNEAVDSSSWILDASDNTQDLALAIDSNTDTRWTTKTNQTNAQWLTIDLNAQVTLNHIQLNSGTSTDAPIGFEIYISDDGINWGQPILTGVAQNSQNILFSEVSTSHIKIIQTESSDRYWWSIHELNIFRSNEVPLSLPEPRSGFVHPGLSHKLSDLQRMKAMVEAGIEPWASSFEAFRQNPFASYDRQVDAYSVDATVLVVKGGNYNHFRNDGLTAYDNAIMWAITGDERHAAKAVEILNAWSDLRKIDHSGTFPLDAGRVMWKSLEAAEILKHTYDGWAEEDFAAFAEMLVYPGYSNTTEPTAAMASEDVTFYWYMYQGDPGRYGNQGLFAMRGMMTMGVLLDNQRMYDRAVRIISGLPPREDDLPYVAGPPISNGIPNSSSNEFYDEFSVTSRGNTHPDIGYNEVIGHYIFENGQSSESSRDQGHALVGVSIINTMAEMSWNQGDDIWSILDNRPLKGMEFYVKYNLTYSKSFPDQLTPWEPTVESGEYMEHLDKSGRWYSKKINPYLGANLVRETRGTLILEGVYELVLGHYKSRMNLDADKMLWTQRALDNVIEEQGNELAGYPIDHPGFGGLKFRRVSPGDPINGYTNGLPNYDMHVLPKTIEAENFDHFTTLGQDKTYFDTTLGNVGGQYRLDESVDIELQQNELVVSMDEQEWLTYTVSIPNTDTYDFSIEYQSDANATIEIQINGVNVFEAVELNAVDDFLILKLSENIELTQSVVQLKVKINSAQSLVKLNKIIIE